MTRISLSEAYDDRSVIAKLEKMSDQVDTNTETSNNAATSAQASAEASEASRQAAETAKAGALDAQTKANAASAKAESAAAQVIDKVAKTGTTTPQVITGTGGLQVQGDLSVGGDLTVSETGSVHFDGSDMEVGGMAIEKSSTATVLSNEAGGIRFRGSVTVPTTATGVKTQDAVNGQRLQADLDAYAPMVRTSGNQTISGIKTFGGGIIGQFRYAGSIISTSANQWFTVAKFGKNIARQATLHIFSRTTDNFVNIDVLTKSLNVECKATASAIRNEFKFAETEDSLILYVNVKQAITTFLKVDKLGSYSTVLPLSDLDTSVLTGTPVDAPTVGGDIVAVYDSVEMKTW